MDRTNPVIFFDLDGTLTDPQTGIVGSIRYALDKLGLNAPQDDDLTWCIGPPLLESLSQIVGKELAPLALKHYRDRFSDIGWQENHVYPGIPEVLRQLTDADAQLYVATSKPLVFAERIVKHFDLDRYFLRIFGSQLDGTLSHKAELLRFALDEIMPKETAVMIGDRMHDVVGAKSNQMRSIGVTYGYGSREELENAGADRLIDAPEELLSALCESAAKNRFNE